MNDQFQAVGQSTVVGQAKGTCQLIRPKFGPGQLLRDDDLRQGVDYTRDLSRLLFRSFFGCGVVCGLEVQPTFECEVLTITIEAGVALDCAGDPVYVCTTQSVVIDPRCMRTPLAPPLWVVLRRVERCCAPRAAACADDDDEAATICTREVDGFEIRVLQVPSGKLLQCVCGCPIPDPDHPPLVTDCQCANPELNCLQGHYTGACGCACADCVAGCSGDDCGCDWILLAKLVVPDPANKNEWLAEHNVRRFIRPVLMRDPLLARSAPLGATVPATTEEVAAAAAAKAAANSAAAKKAAAKKAAAKKAVAKKAVAKKVAAKHFVPALAPQGGAA